MPRGMIIMDWDDRSGASSIASHPSELSLDDAVFMQIYSTHEYSGTTGMISLMSGNLNLASYYSGSEHDVYVILILGIEEDPDAYEDGLSDLMRVVIEKIDDPQLQSLLPSYYQRLAEYPSLTPEQLLMMIYTDEAKNMIFSRLQKEGMLSKAEVDIWLADQFNSGFVNVEGTLKALINLLRLESGFPSLPFTLYIIWHLRCLSIL